MSSSSFFDFRDRVTRPNRRKSGNGDAAGANGPPGAAPGPPPSGPSPSGPPRVDPLTVTQFTRQVDRVLKTGMPAAVWVKGELSSYRHQQASGHVYLTLKDATSCVDCVMWRDDAATLKFTPQVGMEVLVSGRVQVYVERGKYQLYVTRLQPLGQGALELAFRQLCEKLQREGLFAQERKKPVPRYPLRIVIVTSRQTAALQDVLKVFRGFPWLRLFLYNVPVQGDAAGKTIAAALRHLDRHIQALGDGEGADLILLGRGGGSPEDLCCFNDEAVARAVAASRVPVVTGIGHEVDVSVADLVADYHAHTPTEAARVVVQHWRAAPERVDTSAVRLARSVRGIVQDARRQLSNIERHETFRRPKLRVYMFRQLMDDREKTLALMVGDRLRGLQHALRDLGERLDQHHPSRLLARSREMLQAGAQRLHAGQLARLKDILDGVNRIDTMLVERHPRHRVRLERERLAALESRFRRAGAESLQRRLNRLEALGRQLEAVGPEQVLRRGYSITMRKKTREVVRSMSHVRPGDRMVTRFADGEVEWTAEDSKQLPLFPS